MHTNSHQSTELCSSSIHLRFIGCEFAGLFYLVYSPFILRGKSAACVHRQRETRFHDPAHARTDLPPSSRIGPVSSGRYRGTPFLWFRQKNGPTRPGWLAASKENPDDPVSDSNRECYIGFSFGSSRSEERRVGKECW